MRDEADPNFFIFSSTDKMLFVTVDIIPARTYHQRQNTVISFHPPPHCLNPPIHQDAKPGRHISRRHGDPKSAGKSISISENAGDRRRPQIIPSSIIQRRRKGERRPEVDALVRHSAPSAMETTETCLWLHFDDKELSGDEEDGESNDARNSLKKRRRGTIPRLVH